MLILLQYFDISFMYEVGIQFKVLEKISCNYGGILFTICLLVFVVSHVEAEFLVSTTAKVSCSREAQLKWFILWV